MFLDEQGFEFEPECGRQIKIDETYFWGEKNL